MLQPLKGLKIFGLIVFFLVIFNTDKSFSQEWKNLRSYKKSTGKNILCKGEWLKKDRKRNTEIWKKANRYNLSLNDGFLRYNTIRQIRDFYHWFDEERQEKGHEVNFIGVTYTVAKQFSYFDNFFIRTLIVRDKKVVWFGNEGSKRVFRYFFPKLRDVLQQKTPLVGKKAKEWDVNNSQTEQCQIIEPLYDELSPKTVQHLERMAKGKGIFALGVKKEIRFEGDILNCKSRYEHALSKLYTYYLNNRKN